MKCKNCEKKLQEYSVGTLYFNVCENKHCHLFKVMVFEENINDYKVQETKKKLKDKIK